MKDGGDYTRRQIVRDAQHAESYRKWVEGMTAAERENLRHLGIDEPDTSYHGTGMSDRDLADSPLASEEPDIIAQIEPDAQAEGSGPFDSETLWDALRRMLGELLNQNNAKLTLECFAVVSGASFLGDSMTSIARRHAVTRAAVSKRCIDIARQLNLPPSRSMRAVTARDAYRQAQIKINQTTNQ
jgi:hypothetical protein